MPQEREFALVFKVLNNAFSPPLQAGLRSGRQGARRRQMHLLGPTEYDEAKQVQLAQDMITRGVDGLGISAGNPKAMARIMKKAKDKGIPVVTFDSDVLPGGRRAALDLHRHRQLRVRRRRWRRRCWRQEEGRHRLHPVRRAGLAKTSRPRPRHPRHARRRRQGQAGRSASTGQNGWTEPAGCPVYNNDDITLAAQQVQRRYDHQP